MKKLLFLTILMCVSFVSFSQSKNPIFVDDVTDIVVGDESVYIKRFDRVFDCADCLHWVGKMNECVKTFKELEKIKDSLSKNDVSKYIRTYNQCSRDFNTYLYALDKHHDAHWYVKRDINKATNCSILSGSMTIIVSNDLMKKCKHYKIVSNK